MKKALLPVQILLKRAGLNVEVRIDPIIPLYTDMTDQISSLFFELKKRGVKKATLSYLHLRPGIWKQLREELPDKVFKIIETFFPSRKWQKVGTSTMSRLIPLNLRIRGYRRFKELAQSYGIKAEVCACKNPDMKANKCVSYYQRNMHEYFTVEQLRLF